MSQGYIAVDLGAESGRVIVGVLADGRLRLEEVHRFSHEPVWLPTGLHWDITGIWREIVAGLRKAATWTKTNGVAPVSVGVDTWGVDWALLDKAGELVGAPHAYRDPRNQAAYDEAVAKLGRDYIYQTTGIQFMALNTLYSLYAHHRAGATALENADRLVFMPDLFHFWLSGEIAIEATIASTSQMVDCHSGDWAREMISRLGMPTHLLGRISPAGTTVGTLRRKIAEETGLSPSVRVIAPASHDTASAVAAVPANGEVAAATGTGATHNNWCYLSSGTWSLLGAELNAPCVSPAAQAASYTNELGIGGTIRFLKNIPGLWLVQECRRDLARRGQEFDYRALTQLAAGAEALGTLVDPAHDSFQSPGDMLAKLSDYARSTCQPTPQSPGQFVRTCLESLALAYREKLETLESILNHRFEMVHIVGGGGKNSLLNQMTADATGRDVIVGPFEATAAGNALVQAMAIGHLRDIAELRRVVAQSFELITYRPTDVARWHDAFDRYRRLGS